MLKRPVGRSRMMAPRFSHVHHEPLLNQFGQDFCQSLSAQAVSLMVFNKNVVHLFETSPYSKITSDSAPSTSILRKSTGSVSQWLNLLASTISVSYDSFGLGRACRLDAIESFWAA